MCCASAVLGRSRLHGSARTPTSQDGRRRVRRAMNTAGRMTEGRTALQGPRVAVIGIDCATPQLLFDKLSDELPNINALMQRGMHGELASITPPITIPAWACAMTGKTPGQLAIYGMRNRKDTSYDGLSLATRLSVQEPA